MDRAKEAASTKIFNKVLKGVKPTDSEVKEITRKVNNLMVLLGTVVPKDVELRVAGSIARGTNLRGNADVDIFMLFKKNVDREKLVKLGVEYGKKAVLKEKGRYEIKYAEHPYIRLYFDSMGMKVDLVPARKIDSIDEMGTTVDRTPMHTEFINSHLTVRQRDEVRILKFLLKAHSIYGAEVKTNGFSGYLCELMIHHYGSLFNLLTAASSFRLPLIIEPKGRKEHKDQSLTKRFNSNFIVIDPVDQNRNVAAGVSADSLARFSLVARNFMEKPSEDAFRRPGVPAANSASLIKKMCDAAGLDLFITVIKVPDKSEDIIYPQLRKVNDQISHHIQQNGFSVYVGTQFVSGREGVMMILAPKQQLASRLLKGPDAFVPGAAQNFIKKHAKGIGFIINGSTIFSLEKAKYRNIKEVLDSLPPTLLRHKDINLNGAKISVGSVPKALAETAYLEIRKKFIV